MTLMVQEITDMHHHSWQSNTVLYKQWVIGQIREGIKNS
jgi:hypothetical protein